MSYVLSASWSISQIISKEKAIAFCESLEERSPDVFKNLSLLYEMHRKRNTFDDRSFYRFVVDLLCLQTKHSLADRLSAENLKPVCDPNHRCRCCEAWNDDVRRHAFKKANKEIKKMFEGSSNSFELFHEFAELAVQNEVERQEFLAAAALPVASAAALPVASAAALPVASAAALPVASAAALPSTADEFGWILERHAIRAVEITSAALPVAAADDDCKIYD